MSYTNKINKNIPLSPHLGIYKWQLNSIMSILHRISGAAMYFYLLCFFWLFSFNVFYPENTVILFINNFFAHNILGKLILCKISFLFYYHLLNGIRHLFWDIGQGFDIRITQITGTIILICSLLLSALTALVIYC